MTTGLTFFKAVPHAATRNVPGGGSAEALTLEQIRVRAENLEAHEPAHQYYTGELSIDAAPFEAHLGMTAVATPSGWAFNFSAGTCGWDMAGANSEELVLALPFRPGDSILTVTMRLEGSATGGGGHSALPANMPVIQLIRKDVTTGVFTIVDSTTDSSANVAAYDAVHDVEISLGPGHSYVANAVYYVRIIAEGGANAEPGSARVYSLKFTGLARSYRSSVEAYQ